MKLTRNVQVARLSGWILLILLIGASGFRTYDAVSELPNAGFYDHGIFLRQVDTYHRTGRLYDVHRREFFHPGSAVFKYPPPAALLYIALREPGTSLWSQARPVVVASFVALAGSLILICAVFKPPLWRVVLLIVVFMNWRGHWESLSAPQWEPLLLLPLTLCVVLPPKRGWFSGLVIGIAGAVKLYPWLMAGYFALRLQWRNLLGVGIGACIAFSTSSFLLTQDLSVQFLSQILPRLGGISLSNENVGVAGQLARLSYSVLDTLPPSVELDYQSPRLLDTTLFRDTTAFARHQPNSENSRLLQDEGPRALHTLTWVMMIILSLGMGGLTLRAIGRAPPGPELEIISFSLALTLLVALMPTSWANYQSLLVLPASVAIVKAPTPGTSRALWSLLLLAVLLGSIPIWRLLESHPEAASFLVGLLPIFLWLSLLRLLYLHSEERPQAS